MSVPGRSPNPFSLLLNAEETDPKIMSWDAFPDLDQELKVCDSISPESEHESTLKTEAVDDKGDKSKTATGLCRRKRLGYHQWLQMERFFKVTPHPSKQLRQNLAKTLSLTPHQVQVWFQNRRVKKKNEVKARPLPYISSDKLHALYPNPNPNQGDTVPVVIPNSLTIPKPLPVPIGIRMGMSIVPPSNKQLSLYPNTMPLLKHHGHSLSNVSDLAVAEQLLSFNEIHNAKMQKSTTLFMNPTTHPIFPNISLPKYPFFPTSTAQKGLSFSDPSPLRLPFVNNNGDTVLPPLWK